MLDHGGEKTKQKKNHPSTLRKRLFVPVVPPKASNAENIFFSFVFSHFPHLSNSTPRWAYLWLLDDLDAAPAETSCWLPPRDPSL